MATVVLCSASGAPGATTTALGLTLTWPYDVLLVDADRTPSQAVLAGYLRGAAAHDGGLPGILQAHRERRSLSDAVAEHSMPLPSPPRRQTRDADVGRRFLPGFVNLGSIDVFAAVWADLAATLRSATFDSIVDAGRIGTRGLPADLLAASDLVAVVCRTSLVSLAGLRLYLAPLVEAAPPGGVGLVLVGPGRPYRAQEVAEQFGVPVLAEIAWAAREASDLHEGQPLTAGWSRQGLARSYAAASGRLADQLQSQRRRVGVPTP